MKTRIDQHEPNDPVTGVAPAASTNRTVDVARGSTRAPASGFRAFVRRRELVIFFALSYLIAWSTLPFGSFLAFAPLLSALLVVSVAEGLPGLAQLGRRLIRWRVNWIWYAAAIAVPLLVHAVAVGLNTATDAPAPLFAQFVPWYSVLFVLGLGMVNPTEGPLGEEPAWRGFAQPRFQSSRSPLVSAAVLGLLITGWHLPLVFMPQFDLGLPDIATTVMVTFWYAWLFNRTGGSVLLTLIAHVTEGSVNIQAMWSAGPYAERLSWMWLLAWTLLVVALLIFDRRTWRSAPESAIDRVHGQRS
jgi:membrane protease YdiL (CAAX protease family)